MLSHTVLGRGTKQTHGFVGSWCDEISPRFLVLASLLKRPESLPGQPGEVLNKKSPPKCKWDHIISYNEKALYAPREHLANCCGWTCHQELLSKCCWNRANSPPLDLCRKEEELCPLSLLIASRRLAFFTTPARTSVLRLVLFLAYHTTKEKFILDRPWPFYPLIHLQNTH